METLKNEFRWRMVKRKKQVVNLCAALGFILTFGMAESGLAKDAVSADTTPDYSHTLEGSTDHATSGNDYNIKMNTSNAKDLFNSFNIGRDISVNITGGNSYVIKVKESGGLSHIYGQLNGPNVFMQNSSGVTFYESSQINVDSLLATTAMNIDFNENGFDLSDSGDASIINYGDIRVSDGGFAILAAPYVENNGFIQADLGTIVLASTTAMTVDLRGDGLITYGVTDESLSKAGVKNTGTLQAKSGVVHISAAVASDVIESVVNLDGVIDADSFGEGEDGGTVLISSTGDINMNDVKITANGGTNANGGTVDTWADGLNNFSEDATIEVKGGSESGNGGSIDISGNDIIFGGNIDATAANGDGGELILDPFAFTIRDGSGKFSFGPIVNVIYEETVEALSQAGVKVKLEANYLVMLENLTDGVLEAGSGDIILRTLKNLGGVVFADKNDTISTTSGDIIIEAGWGGINVGHLETGRDNDVSAGSINLTTSVNGTTTGGNINTKSLTVSGKTQSATTPSSDNINIDAHGNVTVDGQINVSSETTGDNSNAIAGVNISSKYGDININDTINVISATSGLNSDATAQLDLFTEAGDITTGDIVVQTEIVSLNLASVDGDLTFGNVDIAATNVNDANKEVQFSAEEGNVTGGNITSDAGVYIDATDTLLTGVNGNVNVGDIDTDSADKAININSNRAVTTGTLAGNADIDAGGDVTTSDIESASGLLIEGNNVETGNIKTTDSDKTIAFFANSAVTTGTLAGNAFIFASGDVTTSDIESASGLAIEGDNVETGNIKTIDSDQAIDILANSEFTTGTLAGNAHIVAGGDVTTSDIESASGISIEGDNVETGNIETTDADQTIEIMANSAVTTGTLAGNADIVAGGDVTTSDIESASGLAIEGDNVETGNIETTDADQTIEILANSAVKTGTLSGNANIVAGGNVTTSDIESTSGASIEGNNVQTENIDGTISILAQGNIKTKNITGAVDVSLDAIGNVNTRKINASNDIDINSGGNIVTRNLTSGDDIDIVAVGNVNTRRINASDNVNINSGGNVSTRNIVGGYDVSIIADGNVTTRKIKAIDNDVYIESGADVVTRDITSGDDTDIIAGGNVTTDNISSDDDVHITSGEAVTTQDISSGDDITIDAVNDINTNNIFALNTGFSKGSDVSAEIEIDTYGSVNVNGDIFAGATASGAGTSDVLVDINAGEIDVNGSLITTASAEGGDSTVFISIYAEDGSAEVNGDVSASANSIVGNSYSNTQISGKSGVSVVDNVSSFTLSLLGSSSASNHFGSSEGGVIIGGDVVLNSVSISNDASSIISSNIQTDIEVKGDVSIVSNSTNGYSVSLVKLTSNTGGVSIEGDVDSTASSKNDYAYALVELGALGEIDISGDVDVEGSNEATGNADAKIEIKTPDNVTIDGNISVTSTAVDGVAESMTNIHSDDAVTDISGDISSSATSINGKATSVVNVSGEQELIIVGNVSSGASSENGDATTSISLSSDKGDIDILGVIAARSSSINNYAASHLSLSAGGEILLSALLPDPLAEANSALVQQRESGVDSEADGEAEIILDAVGDVRFFDANNFDQNGIHRETGTSFDPNGYDINGYDINGYDISGFDINGFDINGIHRDTGTAFGPDGYDINGFDIAGYDRDGYDISGFDINGYDRDGFDANGFDIAGIHRDTGTPFNPDGFDVSGNPAPNNPSDILIAENGGSDDGQNNNAGNNSGLSNLEPAGGGSDECEFMNCDESNS